MKNLLYRFTTEEKAEIEIETSEGKIWFGIDETHVEIDYNDCHLLIDALHKCAEHHMRERSGLTQKSVNV